MARSNINGDTTASGVVLENFARVATVESLSATIVEANEGDPAYS
jgi:hypothetical protein